MKKPRTVKTILGLEIEDGLVVFSQRNIGMVDLYIVKVVHGQKLLNAQFHHGAVFTIIRVHDNLTDRRFLNL